MSSNTLPPAPEAPRDGLLVLLVEDNPGDADLVRESLAGKSAGVEIIHVERLSEGRARIEAGGVDVVLLDLSLPDASGLEGIERLHQAALDVPIVVLTGTADEALGARAVHAGAQDYLVKGQTDTWLLHRALRYAIERQQFHAARARLLAQERAARNAAEAHEARMSFLAAASLLLAGAMDRDLLRARLGEVMALAVPQFADCALITRGDHDDGGAPGSAGHEGGDEPPGSSPGSALLALRHVAPEKEPLVRALYESARAELPGHEDGPPSLGQLAVCSRVDVPVDAHDPRAGTITLLYTAESGRSHPPEDRVMMADLARSVHLAAENLRVHESRRRAVAQREDFVAVASHELRTPLGTLILQMNTLKSGIDALPEDSREPLQARWAKAEKQLGRLEQLVYTLLDVARSGALRIDLQREPVDLSQLTRDVVERFAEQAEKAGVRLELRAGVPVVGSWDRLRVEQILTNLMSNALKYGSNAPVLVTVTASEGRGVVSVRDHGIGIASADAARIFERFERAVSARRYSGLGLGLHIAQEIAIGHGGSIEVSSEVGAGSTFVLTLPLAAPEAASPRPGVPA